MAFQLDSLRRASPGCNVQLSGGEPTVRDDLPAIIRMARELCAVHPESEIVKVCEGDLNRVNAKVVFDAAKNGDELALKVFHRYVKYLGQLVASLVN